MMENHNQLQYQLIEFILIVISSNVAKIFCGSFSVLYSINFVPNAYNEILFVLHSGDFLF